MLNNLKISTAVITEQESRKRKTIVLKYVAKAGRIMLDFFCFSSSILSEILLRPVYS